MLKKRRDKQTKKTKGCFHCGQLGHLAKECPTLKTKKTESYIPPRRIRFKSTKDMEDFKGRIKAFRHDSQQNQSLQSNLYQPILKELLSYLLFQYGEQKNFLLHPSQVKLAFIDSFEEEASMSFQFAETSAITGYITFSTSAIENIVANDTISGYENEQQWTKNICNDKEGILFWIFIHEFTHLFDGFNNDRHDDLFFQKVDEIAHEHIFLFC